MNTYILYIAEKFSKLMQNKKIFLSLTIIIICYLMKFLASIPFWTIFIIKFSYQKKID